MEQGPSKTNKFSAGQEIPYFIKPEILLTFREIPLLASSVSHSNLANIKTHFTFSANLR